MTKYYIAIGLITLAVIAELIYGFMKGGTPWEARKEKLDQTRVADIQTLKYAVEDYFRINYTLPKTLVDIKTTKTYVVDQSQVNDPETNIDYEYKVSGQTSYQLCANFSTDSLNDKKKQSYSSVEFKHPKGHHCFDFKVNYNSSSANSNPQDDYTHWVPTKYHDVAKKYEKIGQTFVVTNDRVLNSITVRLFFTTNNENGLLSLREVSDDNDLEKGLLLASEKFTAKIFALNEDYQININLTNSVQLQSGKKYVIIVEAADPSSEINVAYSQNNPNSSGDMYDYYLSNLPNLDPTIYSYAWNKQEKYDIYFKLL